METLLEAFRWRSASYLLLITALICLLSEVESLQCFNCRGVLYYDPDSCFNPVRGKTVRQECVGDEVCETRYHREESFESIIERGCTNACAGRQYIWTDYFQVHCCDTNECNGGNNIKYSFTSLLLTLICTLLFMHR